MHQPQAYLNGRYIPADQASIPLYDAGFVLGVTVTEQMRTFGGKLFHTARHLNRLYRSLERVGIDCPLSAEEMTDVAQQIVAHNHPLLEKGDDLGLVIFVTPGAQRSISGGKRTGPTVGLHTFPLAFELWADRYETGESLVVTRTRQVPAECWPAEIKCRSRMHYYLADREAAHIEEGARALLTDLDGFVTETASANIAVYRKTEGLLTPPHTKALGGISLATLAELAAEQGIPIREYDLRPDDVLAADEVFLTSTPLCMLPVTRVNRQPIGTGTPGPLFERVLTAWSKRVGIDIAQQAKQFAHRPV